MTGRALPIRRTIHEFADPLKFGRVIIADASHEPLAPSIRSSSREGGSPKSEGVEGLSKTLRLQRSEVLSGRGDFVLSSGVQRCASADGSRMRTRRAGPCGS